MKSLCIVLAIVCLIAVPTLDAQQSGWEIVRADYGSGNNWVDVTARVRSLVQGHALAFTVDGNTMGAVARRGRNRTLRLQLRDSRGNQRQITYRDRQQVKLQVYNGNQGGLQISRALYGKDNRVANVATRLNSMIQGDQLNIQVNNQTMGGDPAPGQDKTLTVDYALNGRDNQATTNEGQQLRLGYGTATQGSLYINHASYGSESRSSDVTARLNSMIHGDQLDLQVNNQNMGTDPAPNQNKKLSIQYVLNGRTSEVFVNEGETLRLGFDVENQRALQINRATYGTGYLTSDVTARLNSMIHGDQVNLQVTNTSMGGDPAPNQNKTLTVQYAMNGRTSQVVVKEGEVLRLGEGTNSQGSLQINRASYGSANRNADVTKRLDSMIQGDQLNVQVTNSNMGGDPAPGQAKALTVQYAQNGRTNQIVANEGETLHLPYDSEGGLVQRVRCESLQDNNFGRKYCPADTRGGVRLSRRISDSECIQDSSWGYDSRSIWVDRGCRAEFVMQGDVWSPGPSSSTTLPIGTELSIRTNEAIDSQTTDVGRSFSGFVEKDVLDMNGIVTIPRGSAAQLLIRNVNGSGDTSNSDLVLDVSSVTINGMQYVVSTGDLTREGGQGVGANRKTAIMLGGGAALGTVIGAIVGGGKGAAIGAAIGAGAGLGTQVLTRGKHVRVPAETLLTFRLDQVLRLQAMR